MSLANFVVVVLLLTSFKCTSVIGFGFVPPAMVAGFSSVVNLLACRFTECCEKPWITNNSSGILHDLERKIHGQHLVVSAVLKHIKAHVNPDNSPSKALALSFHGWMGTGKNYVAKIIAENLYKKGMNSEYVHLISAVQEFPHDDKVPEYKDKLQALIESSVKKCPQSLFIFDELERIPGGLLDIIKPYLQPYDHLHGTDYRKAIFLFLGIMAYTSIFVTSASAGDDIASYALDHWRNGQIREEIQLKDMEHIIAESAFYSEEEMGLSNSELISSNVITAFVPLLPLSKTHVRQCIMDSIVEKGYVKRRADIRRKDIDKVLEQLQFLPKEEEVYSTSGCKRVAEKVIYVFEK